MSTMVYYVRKYRVENECYLSPGPRKGAVEYKAVANARSRAFHISAIVPPAFVSANKAAPVINAICKADKDNISLTGRSQDAG